MPVTRPKRKIAKYKRSLLLEEFAVVSARAADTTKARSRCFVVEEGKNKELKLQIYRVTLTAESVLENGIVNLLRLRPDDLVKIHSAKRAEANKSQKQKQRGVAYRSSQRYSTR